VKYAYFPGCSLESTSWEFDHSTRAVFRALDIGLEEIPDWVCCGSTPAHATNTSIAVGLPVLNLQKAQAMGMPLMTACSSCYSRLRTANHKVRHQPEEKAEAERLTGHPYDGGADVLHVLDVLVNHFGVEAIRARVRQPLAGLRIASYYGCLLSRPPEIAAFDDPEHPTAMDRLVEAAGAEAVDWPYKTECCGASLSMTNTKVVCRLSHRLISMARQAGADCIVVACPMCQVNLDMRQKDAASAYGPLPETPVLFITQLLGIALGLSRRDVGLGALTISADRMLNSIRAVAVEAAGGQS
jgi:heterodisulfide reductase subunit B2